MDPKIEELKRKISELEKKLDGNEIIPKNKVKPSESFAPTKTFLKWKSPSRVFIQRDKLWYLKVATIALLLILFFAFLQDFIVILVICIIVLIAFLLASIPPEQVSHSITSKGINTIDRLYKWAELKHFRINKKEKYLIVNIKTSLKFPPRLEILIDPKDEEKVVRLVGNRLEYEEVDAKQGWLSKMTDGEVIQPKKYYKLFVKSSSKKKSEKKVEK
ncbi:MAG: hypothetical protein ABIE03_05800 [Patescibacteria group bacterium]|nr:hypothetical protein [Patescibacteria group bacterium]